MITKGPGTETESFLAGTAVGISVGFFLGVVIVGSLL